MLNDSMKVLSEGLPGRLKRNSILLQSAQWSSEREMSSVPLSTLLRCGDLLAEILSGSRAFPAN